MEESNWATGQRRLLLRPFDFFAEFHRNRKYINKREKRFIVEQVQETAKPGQGEGDVAEGSPTVRPKAPIK